MRDDCWSIEITTADAPMWSADLATLLGTMGTSADAQRDNDAPVSVHVPEGWTSLGGGLVPRGWTMELFVDVDGESHIVYLAQRPAAPVGMLLSGESNPVPFDHDGQQWWSIDVVTTPGRTTVVGDAGLGAFYINSDLSRDQLVTIIDSLVPTRSDMIPQAGLAPSDTVVDEMATELDSDVPFDTALDTVAGSVPSDVVTEASPSVPVASAPEGTPPSSGCGVPVGLSLIES